MNQYMECLGRLKYHQREKFWIADCPAISEDAEIYVQGVENEISTKHLSLAEKIFMDFEKINQLALNRIYSCIKNLDGEQLSLLILHVFDDIHSVTASPSNFMLTYGFGSNEFDSKGNYVACNRYTVKFMEKLQPLSVEEWFV